MTKEYDEALQMLCDAVNLPRIPGRIETIRETLKIFLKAKAESETPFWKRIYYKIFTRQRA